MPAGVPVATFAIGDAGATNAGAVRRGPARRRRTRRCVRPSLPIGRSGVSRPPHRSSTSPRRREPSDHPIAPPATIGMLGGGQLGRYADRRRPPRRLRHGRARSRSRRAGRERWPTSISWPAYDDAAALDELARRCAVVTTEFENPPALALHRLARDVIVAPPARAVAIAQDRIAEKSFLERAGFAVAPCAALIDASDLDAAVALGGPAIVKTARFGYDGKGQRSVSDAAGHGGGVGGVRPRAVHRRTATAPRPRDQRRRRPSP